MALSAIARRILANAMFSRPEAEEICNAIDNVAIGNATNATVTNFTATNATITNLTATNSALANAAIANGSITANGTVTLGNLTNFALGTGSGTRIGTAANQKLGLFAVTPVIQPASTGEIVGGTGNGATNANLVNATFNGNLGSTAYTINDAIKALKQLGAMAQ